MVFILAISFWHLAFSSEGQNNYNSKSLFSKDCKHENEEYKVIKVFDGDTVLLNNTVKIRLLGIDAFEHDQLPYGQTAKDFLSRLTLEKNVCVETDKEDKDIYGRTLGYVFIMNEFVNEKLVQNGQALLYDFPPNIKYLSKLKDAQIYARKNMLGVWEKQDYIPETPYQHRHK